MATLDKVDAFFASSKGIKVIAPSAQIKPVDYAKQYAHSKMLDRVKGFFAHPEKVRVAAPASVAGHMNHAERYAETMGAKIANAMAKAAGSEKSAGSQPTMNPYAAGRAAKAAAPAQKLEDSASLVKRKGRSL